MPVCCKCRLEKPSAEFYAGRTECKPCKKAISWASKKKRMERDSAYREARNAEISEWKRLNPEKVRAWKAAWRRTPVARVASRLRERLARPVGRGVARHCRDLLVRQKWLCAVCAGDLRDGKHLDHIIPIAAGGGSVAGNFQWLCQPCNLAKSARNPIEFMQSRGLLL
jgi:5-methylcytosine-specific restriction endonuclease McrA